MSSRSWAFGSILLALGGAATLAAAPPTDVPPAPSAAPATSPKESSPKAPSETAPATTGAATTGAAATGSTSPGTAPQPKAAANAAANADLKGTANQGSTSAPGSVSGQGGVKAQGNLAQPGTTGAQGSANVQAGAAAGRQAGQPVQPSQTQPVQPNQGATGTAKVGGQATVPGAQPAPGQTNATGQANVNAQGSTAAGTQTNVNAQTNLPANFSTAIGLGFAAGRNDLTISTVQPGSVFATTGITAGDRIVSIAGQTFASPMAFQQYLYRVPVGQRVPIVVWRNGAQQTIYWTPDQAFVQSLPPIAPAPLVHGGPIFASLTYVPGRPLGIQMDSRVQDATIVTAVSAGSPAEQAGVQIGDRITALNEQAVGGPSDFLNKLGQLPPQSPIKLSLARNHDVNVGATGPLPVTAGRPIVPDTTLPPNTTVAPLPGRVTPAPGAVIPPRGPIRRGGVR